MVGQQTYIMRARADDGGVDTLSHAAESLLRGSDRPLTEANVEQAMRDLALANNLERVRIVQQVNSDTNQQRITIYSDSGTVLMQGQWHTPAGNPDFAPEPGTGNTIYQCDFYEYRHHHNNTYRSLQPNEPLNKPDGYTAFAPPSPQVVPHCPGCVPIPVVVQHAAPTFEAEVAPLAQVIFSQQGYAQATFHRDGYSAFIDGDPRDPAARGHERTDRYDNGEVTPNFSDGAHVRTVRDLDHDTQQRLGTVLQRHGESLNIVLRHAGDNAGRYGELLRRPSQTMFFDEHGNVTAVNPRFDSKIEENVRYVVDSQGNLISVVGSDAHISLDRRLNPYHGNIWTDAMTATNVVNELNDSGEALSAIATFQGIFRSYGQIGDNFLGREGHPARQYDNPADAARDAEHLLQLNVDLALHPLVWSVDHMGVPQPAGNINEIQAAMTRVYESASFQALPGDLKQRLHQQYDPLQANLHNPVVLDTMTGGHAGRANWINPMDDWAVARATVDSPNISAAHIVDGYGDVQGVNRRDQSPADRQAAAIRNIQTYGRVFWSENNRGPEHTEQALGTAVLLNADRQQEPHLANERVVMLQRYHDDANFRHAVNDYVMTTPGALEKWTDMVFHSTRNGVISNRTDNSQLLGLSRDQADDFARDTATALAGREFRNDLNYSGENILGGIARRLTLGYWRPGENRNQNRGGVAFQRATQERWANGDEATRAQMEGAMLNIADGALRAQQNAIAHNQPELGAASTSIVTSLDPNMAEDTGRDQTDAWRTITSDERTRNLLNDTMVQRMNAVGHTASDLEQATEQRLLAGEHIVTVTPDQANAAIRNGHVTVPVATGGDTSAAQGTVFDLSAMEHAIRAHDGGAEAARVLATANTTSLVGQNMTNQSTITHLAEAAPSAFSMMMLASLAQAHNGGDLRRYAEMIDRGGENFSTYADLLTNYASRLDHAPNDHARSELMAHAMHDFNALFAGPHAAEAQLAAQALGQELAHDSELAGHLNATYVGLNASSTGSAALSSSLLAGLTAQEHMSFLALQAEGNPQQRAADLEAFLKNHAELNHSIDAGRGLSYMDIAQLLLLAYQPPGHPPGEPNIPVAPPPPCCPGCPCGGLTPGI